MKKFKKFILLEIEDKETSIRILELFDYDRIPISNSTGMKDVVSYKNLFIFFKKDIYVNKNVKYQTDVNVLESNFRYESDKYEDCLMEADAMIESMKYNL